MEKRVLKIEEEMKRITSDLMALQTMLVCERIKHNEEAVCFELLKSSWFVGEAIDDVYRALGRVYSARDEKRGDRI